MGNRAATLIGQQDFDGAVVVLDSLLVTDPDNGLTLSALGFSLLNLQRWDGARVALEAALESGNATPGVPTNLVMALGQLGALDGVQTILDVVDPGPDLALSLVRAGVLASDQLSHRRCEEHAHGEADGDRQHREPHQGHHLRFSKCSNVHRFIL
ncbi:MAG TPA: hypothetical protein EYQ27_10565 [Gemmatimonadetes bacterium]|nr:hypothetical protein [Gemmatimonadota bacterium]